MIFLAACASPPKPAPEVDLPPPIFGDAEETENIDVQGLQRSMGMARPLESLGFREKAFNSCRAGYGYSSSQNCRNLHLMVLNFRLLCRDSEGTVSEIIQLTPVTNGQVRWNLDSQQGYVPTDGEGFGQIVAVMPKSTAKKRLRLTVANDFLLTQAGEVGRIVVPRQWCP